MIDDPLIQLQPYQCAILAFFARRKDHRDSIVLWNGRLCWKSETGAELEQPREPQWAAPIRGQSHDFIIIDEVAFSLDSLSKSSTIPPCQSTHQPASPSLNP